MTENRLARTHRSDGNTYGHAHCQRCGQCWPCHKDGKVDPLPGRWRGPAVIIASAAFGLLAAGCILLWVVP